MQLRSREALIVYLEASGMSERQLARVAGLGHATVNHLVTGRRTRCSVATARAIETALKCAPGTLFEHVEPPEEPREPRSGGQWQQSTPQPGAGSVVPRD
jgi:transcriptional regulator with XRE-family HTH domain